MGKLGDTHYSRIRGWVIISAFSHVSPYGEQLEKVAPHVLQTTNKKNTLNDPTHCKTNNSQQQNQKCGIPKIKKSQKEKHRLDSRKHRARIWARVQGPGPKSQKYKQRKVKIYASIFTLSINNATIDNWTPDTELSKSRIPALEYLSLLRKNSWQPLHASIQAEYLTKSFECLFEKSHNGPSDNGNKIIDQETQHRLDMIVSEQ